MAFARVWISQISYNFSTHYGCSNTQRLKDTPATTSEFSAGSMWGRHAWVSMKRLSNVPEDRARDHGELRDAEHFSTKVWWCKQNDSDDAPIGVRANGIWSGEKKTNSCGQRRWEITRIGERQRCNERSALMCVKEIDEATGQWWMIGRRKEGRKNGRGCTKAGPRQAFDFFSGSETIATESIQKSWICCRCSIRKTQKNERLDKDTLIKYLNISINWYDIVSDA